MNQKEVGKYLSSLFNNHPLPERPTGKLSKAQSREYQQQVEFVVKENQNLKARRVRMLLATGVISSLTALAIFIPQLTPQSSPSLFPSTKPAVVQTIKPEPSEKDAFALQEGEIGYDLNFAEALDIGNMLELRNESRLVNLKIIMSRIDTQTGTEAGLPQLRNPLVVRLVDQGSSTNTTGGQTGFDSDTGRALSEIIVPEFVKKLENEMKQPNTPLTTEERKRGYLGVLLSQVALVEISNQANVQRYIGKKPDSSIMDEVDKTSNLLGKKYVEQISKRQAKPFIIVNKINQ